MNGSAHVQRLWSAALAGRAMAPLRIEVSATTVVLGALATRDYAPMHHDHAYATQISGTRDIFLNTPHQAALFERYLTDWSGPRGRLGRMRFGMKDSVCPGDTLQIAGRIEQAERDAKGCGWLQVVVALTVGGKLMTQCHARLALPLDAADNPWQRRGDDWQP
jgi:acyl dehydratase